MVRPGRLAVAAGRPGQEAALACEPREAGGGRGHEPRAAGATPSLAAGVEEVVSRWRASLGRPESNSFMRTAPLALPRLKRLFVARRADGGGGRARRAYLPRPSVVLRGSRPRARGGERRDRAAGRRRRSSVCVRMGRRARRSPSRPCAMPREQIDPRARWLGWVLAARDPRDRPPLRVPRDRTATKRGSRRRNGGRGTSRSGRRCPRPPSSGRPFARSARSGRRAPRARAADDRVRLGLERVVERLEHGGSPPGGAPAPARAASPRATGSAAAAARAGTCRPRARPGSPRSRSSPSLPKPATTRPSGSAPSSRNVRPAWFSKPGERARSPVELALEQDVADHPPLAGDRVRAAGGRRRAAPSRSGRGSSGRAAGSRRRRRARRLRPRPPPRAPAPLRRGRARSAPARGPGRRRRRAGRARRARSVSPSPIARDLELDARASAARRASTAMLPRSA